MSLDKEMFISQFIRRWHQSRNTRPATSRALLGLFGEIRTAWNLEPLDTKVLNSKLNQLLWHNRDREFSGLTIRQVDLRETGYPLEYYVEQVGEAVEEGREGEIVGIERAVGVEPVEALG